MYSNDGRSQEAEVHSDLGGFQLGRVPRTKLLHPSYTFSLIYVGKRKSSSRNSFRNPFNQNTHHSKITQLEADNIRRSSHELQDKATCRSAIPVNASCTHSNTACTY